MKKKAKSTTVKKKVKDIEKGSEKKVAKKTRKYTPQAENGDLAKNKLKNIYDIFEKISSAEHNDITRENANMNADSPAGMMMKFASTISKLYTDDCLITNKAVKKALKNNWIHIHDKDYYPTHGLNCVHYPLNNMLEKGFTMSFSDNRPAQRIESACTLTSIIFEGVQNEMFGGQSVPAFDFYLAPYVRKTYIEELKNLGTILKKDFSSLYKDNIKDYIYVDLKVNFNKEADVKQYAINRTVKRVHQAMESFIHNMNTIHSRGGNQVVFSSINYGTDTSAEGRCVIRELLNSTYEGIGHGTTAIFPIQIWKKKKGVNFNPKDPNYDLFQLACKVTAKRFFPNFINLDASFNKDKNWKAKDPERYKHEVVTMGCRTRVYEDLFGERTSIGRGNLSFTTINLPRLAMECGKYKHKDFDYILETFFRKLRMAIFIAGEQLYQRYCYQKEAKAKQFPLLMNYIWIDGNKLKPEDTIEPVIKHGTLAIGFIGLAECLISLIGKHHGESEKAQKLGVKIIKYMNKYVEVIKHKYNLNYSVFATPAESLCGKFVKKDRKDFGIIKGVTDKDYYTNSNHIPVYYHCSPRHKAKIEGKYHELTLGGHIFYVEVDGDATHNTEAVMDVVKLMDEYNIGYGSVNHTRNHCLDCGYEDGSKDLKKCPKCKSTRIDKIQRITGYLVGTIDRWNSAKVAELKDRVIHE